LDLLCSAYFAKQRKISERRCNQSTIYWAIWDLHGRSSPAFGADHIWPGRFTGTQTAGRPGVTIEEVIVTGSNIPTAEEGGAEPGGYLSRRRHREIRVRNTADLLTNCRQEMGSTVNQNIANGGDGSRHTQSAWLLPKALVLIDGKRAAIIGGTGFLSGIAGVDINLIPFPMINTLTSEGWRLCCLWQRCGGRCVQHLFKTQIPWSGIGGSIGNTNLGSSRRTRARDVDDCRHGEMIRPIS
jgi:hypothetical protein